VKELLSQAGVSFHVRDVENDLDAYRELIARGFRTVPVTLIGDDPHAIAIRGFDATALRQALGLTPNSSAGGGV
jgi:glutaredoxin